MKVEIDPENSEPNRLSLHFGASNDQERECFEDIDALLSVGNVTSDNKYQLNVTITRAGLTHWKARGKIINTKK